MHAITFGNGQINTSRLNFNAKLYDI